MKKTIFILVIAFFAHLSVMSQNDGSPPQLSTNKADHGVRFSLELGLNMSKLTGDITNEKYSLQYNAGAYVHIPIIRSLYVKTGLQYTAKGVKGKGRENNRIDANYIELPLLLSYRYDFNRNTQLQVNVGPYFAYGISGEIMGNLDTFGDNGVLERYDAGLHMGVGLIADKNAYVGFGYEIGLKNINKTEDDISLKNSNFFVNLGYVF